MQFLLNSKPLLDEYFPTLAGRWRLSRSISTGEHFSGIADFVKTSDRVLLLKEQGNLFLNNGSKCASSRSWIWENSGSDILNIYYDEAERRLYHRLKVKADGALLAASGEHLCVKDRYRGHYSMGANKLVIKQGIEGPAKNYSIESIYVRVNQSNDRTISPE